MSTCPATDLRPCLCVITSCKHDISKTNLWLFAVFIADIVYILLCRWLNSGSEWLTGSHFNVNHCHRPATESIGIHCVTAAVYLAADKRRCQCSCDLFCVCFLVLCGTYTVKSESIRVSNTQEILEIYWKLESLLEIFWLAQNSCTSQCTSKNILQ